MGLVSDAHVGMVTVIRTSDDAGSAGPRRECRLIFGRPPFLTAVHRSSSAGYETTARVALYFGTLRER
jgi:hypothetical protein